MPSRRGKSSLSDPFLMVNLVVEKSRNECNYGLK